MEIAIHVINQSGSFYKDSRARRNAHTSENSRAEIFTVVAIVGESLSGRIYAR